MRKYSINPHILKKLTLVFIALILIGSIFLLATRSVLQFFHSSHHHSSQTITQAPVEGESYGSADQLYASHSDQDIWKVMEEIRTSFHFHNERFSSELRRLRTKEALKNQLKAIEIEGIQEQMHYNIDWIVEDSIAFSQHRISIDDFQVALYTAQQKHTTLVKLVSNL